MTGHSIQQLFFAGAGRQVQPGVQSIEPEKVAVRLALGRAGTAIAQIAKVVLALDDEERAGDVRDVGSRRALPEEVLLGLIFFNDTATNEIYPLSLHDALPISNGNRNDCPRAHQIFHREGLSVLCNI